MTNTKNLDKHLSRILSISFLYTHFKALSSGTELQPFEPNSVMDIIEEKKYDTRLYEAITEGVIEHSASIDSIIKDLAPAWNLEEMNLLNVVILRVSIFEAFIGQLTPVAIVINEAMELKKELGSEDGASLINGVLGNIAKDTNIQTRLKDLQVNI